MFSVIIKNSTLMLLFVLIIHFMIINYISDIQQKYSSSSKTRELKCSTDTKLSKALEEIPVDIQSLEVTSGVEVNQGNGSEDLEQDNTKLKELYDFVYGDKTAECTLSNMFTDIKPCEIPTDQLVECEKDPRDKESTELVFCKNDVDKHFQENELERTTTDRDEIEPITKDGNPIVFSYKESEKELLDGFESFGSSYMLLKN